MSRSVNPSSSEPLRKAAVLVRSLPPEAAATLIGRLSADEARALRASIAELGDVDDEERTGVADEIRSAASPPRAEDQAIDATGVELRIDSSAARMAEAQLPDRTSRTEADPFGSLRDADPLAIATYLAGEQPRAVALVLSHLPGEVASAVLEKYPDSEQAILLAQMSRLGEADPDAVRIIAGDLAEWVHRKSAERRVRADRLAAVRGLLESTAPERRRRLVAQLAQSDPASAEALGFTETKEREAPSESADEAVAVTPTPAPAPPSPALRFEDLDRLDGAALVSALGKLGRRGAVLALAGAGEALLRRVESGLSKRAAKQMRKSIANLGQTTLAEVEAAQFAWAAAAERIVVARKVERVAAMN